MNASPAIQASSRVSVGSKDLLGAVTPDPVGMMLGTGYMRFASPLGVDGLVRTNSTKKLELLAVVSTEEGKGNFRRFIAACKERYACICVWEDWNPLLAPMLERYGFKPARQMEWDGEWVSGWQWDAPNDRHQERSEPPLTPPTKLTGTAHSVP